MDKNHTQTILSYCAELSRYTALIEKELTKPIQKPNDNQERATSDGGRIESAAFFNYSVILPDEDEENNVLVMGDFIVKNTGNATLHAPIICIRISPAPAGTLSGKIRKTKKQTSFLIESSSSNEWQYIQENESEQGKNNGEYWLTPLFCNELMAGNRLVFANFTLHLTKPPEGNSIIVKGFAYFKEQYEGVAALNNIVINF
ncbi:MULTISPECIES: hypothetical protein [Aneurinibacillus]|jgi:hypothetical protein|uniref:Uncharacterized protein n=1 Tax=Aneurinibacillus thermoaerophilus TaxID=143495 RepID=A0A1G7X936_ANETH|nr:MULTISPECIES: hypothetical protein [Aneurinibacillus]AMA73266.1 hypothetical protein ACH33_10620 [Aneurinibacillus sp. XH2]MED0674301.1 hypothetical protein [Aneurinibacillus thermoaerophilus]MED0678319.1 hypothetical protein [Aneurinibacillus thermoaerophilus]MED0736155.1 hypothetical protein [Aneurinibacillus thermoaerophilus]MED0757001.1 hypothetical protein [Aneurinibacillus thermoaerophilus]